MHNGLYTSRGSANCGSSCTSPKPREEQKAVIRGAFDSQCDKHNCKASCSCQPGMFYHEESIRAWKQPCPFDHCEYKTGDVENMKEHMKSLHGVPSPNPQPYKTSGSQYHQTCATQGGDTSFMLVDIDFLKELGELNEPSQTDSGYDTTCTSISFSEDLDDSQDSLFPFPNASTYLYGIGHWVEDYSRIGSTWTAWQEPNLLLQHAFSLSSASIQKNPHVEEAINRFQTSFYGDRASEDHTVS